MIIKEYIRKDTASWIRDLAAGAREHDPDVGIFCNIDMAETLEYLAGMVEDGEIPDTAALAEARERIATYEQRDEAHEQLVRTEYHKRLDAEERIAALEGALGATTGILDRITGDLPQTACFNFHHAKKDQHGYDEGCTPRIRFSTAIVDWFNYRDAARALLTKPATAEETK